MAVNVSIQVKKGDMKKVANLMKRWPKEAPVVLSRAINKTADTVRVKAVRKIAKNTKLKASGIFKKSGGRPIMQTKANRRRLEAEIRVTGKRIPLSLFRARQTKKGVASDTGRGRKLIKSAFIREVFGRNPRAEDRIPGAGHVGVFRVGEKNGKMIQLFGPSLPHVFTGTENIIDETKREAQKLLPKNINTQIKLVLAKKNA